MIDKLKNFDVYLFDFDGTLLNSEPYHKKAHNLVLNEILGRKIEFSDEMFSKYLGKSDNQIYDEYIFSLPKVGVKKDYFLQNLKQYIDISNKKIVIFEDSNSVLELAKTLEIFAVGIETNINTGKLSHANIIIKCE